MRIASQNVAKRLKATGRSMVDKLAHQGADVLAIQEVTAAQLEGWRALLIEAGFTFIVAPTLQGRQGGALLASRSPIKPLTGSAEAAGTRHFAAGLIHGMPVASVYFPVGEGGQQWRLFHQQLIADSTIRQCILIGDFQMVVAKAEISGNSFARWEKDYSYIQMQRMLDDWRDAFREVHGPEHVGHSFQHTSGVRWMNDHALVPRDRTILGCTIDWSVIDERLSDHATLLLDVI